MRRRPVTASRLADKIKHLGWHIQLHLNAAQIVDCEALLRTIPTPVVIEHFGRIPFTSCHWLFLTQGYRTTFRRRTGMAEAVGTISRLRYFQAG